MASSIWTASVVNDGATLCDQPVRNALRLLRFNQHDVTILTGRNSRGFLSAASNGAAGWIHNRHLVARAGRTLDLRRTAAFKGDGSNIASTVVRGTALDLDGHCRPGFVEIQRNGTTAWVFSQYLRIGGKSVREVTPGSVAVVAGLGSDQLNVRDAPLLEDSNVIGSLHGGDSVTLTGQVKPGFASIDWEGGRLWVFTEHVTGDPLAPGQLLTADMRRAGMCISQGPFDPFSHGICDCYDFAVPVGTPIHSIAPGEVIFSAATDDNYRPNKVTVRTQFGDIVYAHLSQRNVSVGDVVGHDTLLGLSGTENGPHLHLQLDFGISPLGLTLTEILDHVGFELGSFPTCGQ